jgi:hypothetical protein
MYTGVYQRIGETCGPGASSHDYRIYKSSWGVTIDNVMIVWLEVLSAVVMNTYIFWDTIPCSP